MNPAQPHKKPQTQLRTSCGVPAKALFLLGHRVCVDYLSGRSSVDGWVHCQTAPRDGALLLGLRRLLQGVLSRQLSKPSSVAASAIDQDVIDAVTQCPVMDVE